MVDLDNGNYEVRFTPTSPGTYCLNIFIFARPIKVVAVVVVVILLLFFLCVKIVFAALPSLLPSQFSQLAPCIIRPGWNGRSWLFTGFTLFYHIRFCRLVTCIHICCICICIHIRHICSLAVWPLVEMSEYMWPILATAGSNFYSI